VTVNSNKDDVERTLALFARTTEEIIALDELRRRMLSGRQLRMKYGVDLTAQDMHIGHAVNLWMYRSMQDLGHKVVLLLGDFTTQIGDPTGRSKTRPVLTQEEIEQNARAIKMQALQVLRTEPDVLEIRRNTEWINAMTPTDMLKLMSNVTVEKLLSREMFRKRMAEGVPIAAHELIYPLIQGWDSVCLDSDLVIIGSDQLYNEMMGRLLQERSGKVAQTIITTKITPGIDGGEKQSKSIGNYVALSHDPREKFGRLMRVPDALVERYLSVYTELHESEIAAILAKQAHRPIEAKYDMAAAIVSRYHGEEAAQAEREWFRATFSERRPPDDAESAKAPSQAPTVYELIRALAGPELSNAALRRLIVQGGVSVAGKRIMDLDERVDFTGPQEIPVRLGKRRWYKVAGPR
jgi:tyrosyl-tRNA synthetase